MPAIITNKLKKQMLLNLEADIADSASRYYVGIGRNEDWNATDETVVPTNTLYTERETRLAVQAIKQVLDTSFVVPRTNWSLGAYYSAYNDNTAGYPTQNYYVLTDENHVYVCLRQPINAETGSPAPSTVQPTGTLTVPVETQDGYVWKFLYAIGALDASKYLAANYVPVKKVFSVDSASPATDVEQYEIQNAAVSGQIVGYEVTNGGSGFTTVPSLIVDGDGVGAECEAVLQGRSIIRVNVSYANNEFKMGSGYTVASVRIDPNATGGGSGAIIRPIFGPNAGLGADPRDDLKSSTFMLNVKTAGEEEANGAAVFPLSEFRQVSLIKNPLVPGTDSDFTTITGNTNRVLNLSSAPSANLRSKNIIEGVTSGAKAIIVKQENEKIWYYQNQGTGFIQFTEGEQINEINGETQTLVLESVGTDPDSYAYEEPDVKILSGDVLYIDNRARIQRSAELTEDIKVIIQL